MGRAVNLEDAGRFISPAGSCVAVGVFDGVHLGHQDIISRVRRHAGQLGLTSAVLTFDPHPLEVIHKGAPPLLTGLDERKELIESLGIELVVIARFDSRMAGLTPGEFAAEVLCGRLRARYVVVGFNFTFGRGASGDPGTLVSCGKELGFAVEVAEPVRIEGQAVGSTEIRKLISDGQMELAACMLGRPFLLKGKVVPGARRGRSLGFPTANLSVAPGIIVPKDGVYAVRLRIGDVIYPGVLNIGVKPTFGAEHRTLEVHVIGFEGDLYGREVRVEFLKRLRDERRFPAASALRAQIEQDIAVTRALLGADDAPEVGALCAKSSVYKPRSLC